MAKAELDLELPSDMEAEELLIGCLLVDSRRYCEIANKIGPNDFWDDNHRFVFESLSALAAGNAIDTRPRNDRSPIDPKCVMDHMASRGRTVRLAAYFEAIGTGWDYLYYASRIADASRRRALILAAHDMQLDARTFSNDTAGIVDAVLRRAAELSVGVGSQSRLVSISQVVREELLPKFERQIYGDGEFDAKKISTGWYSVDSILGGLHAGGLITIAGRTGQGKTTFASNICSHVAFSLGKKALFVTLEQPQREIAEAVWRGLAEVGSIREELTRDQNRERLGKLIDLLETVCTDNLMLFDGSSITVEQISAVARMQLAKGLDLLVIDYLGRIRKPGGNDPIAYKIEHITTTLKDLAKQLDIPVLLLCQLSRQFDENSDDEPSLTHLRDSGAIEQDSDAVIFVWRPKSGEHTKVKIGKNRHGIVGTTELTFIGACKKFIEIPKERFSAFDEFNG